MSKNLYNPLPKSFTITYDLEGTGNPQEFTARAMDITSFDEPVYSHMKKHLADAVVWHKGIKVNYDHDLAQALKEVTVG